MTLGYTNFTRDESAPARLAFASCRHLPAKFLATLLLCTVQAVFAAPDDRIDDAKPDKNVWVHRGFKEFAQGRFEDGGSKLYVNAQGTIGLIHTLDINNDGYADLPLANSHDYIERGPTDVYRRSQDGKSWLRQRMPSDSGWKSRIVDLDKDGHADLIVANGENGVTSRLSSYVYWGSPKGLSAGRTDLPTVGAYDVAVLDINHDGHLDLVFPSAWVDHHNPGKPMLARVYLGAKDRNFVDATKHYNIEGIGACAIAAADLNEDGFVDLVVANYRDGFNYDTESFVYWGTEDGVNTKKPLRLPTSAPMQVLVADLNQDGKQDLIFAGGNRVQIYWNESDTFHREKQLVLNVTGHTSHFAQGVVQCAVADIDGDGIKELLVTTEDGVQIRSSRDLQKVQTTLRQTHVHWITACDMDADGRQDLVVSRYSDGTVYDTQSLIYWNGPSGFSLQRATKFSTGGALTNTAGDLDGDGQAEVVFNSTKSGHVKGIYNYIYLGNEQAEYSVEHRLELPTDGGDACTIADLDMDGHPEVVFAQSVKSHDGNRNILRIYRGGPNGPVPDHFLDLPTNNALQDVRIADFNRDGYLDLFFVCQVYDTKPETLAKSAGIYYGSKDGFSAGQWEPIGMFGNSGALADVNKDGYLDLLFVDKRNYVLIYLGSHTGYSQDHTWKVPCPGLKTAGAITTADLNQDGWLDLIVTTMGHYTGLEDTLHVFYGSVKGYDPENSQELLGGYSPGGAVVADFNRDGNLDVVVTAYSSPTARVLPTQLFWGNGETLDLDHPVNLPTESSVTALQADLNRDGWIDLFLPCHRNDIGHQVDSLIYWNSPKGFTVDKVTRLPGLGPHGTFRSELGNAYTRKPEESYISPPFDMKGQTAERIQWSAKVPPPSKLRFQLRWSTTKEQLGQAQWMGSEGANTYFERSGDRVSIPSGSAQWLQYRAIFVSPYGCRSPRLSEVRVDLQPR